MKRIPLKVIIAILSLVISVLCLSLSVYGQIKNHSFISYDSTLFGIHIQLYKFNMFFCIIGIILFIRYLIITDDKTFSKKYLFLIPSIIVSILFIYSIIALHSRNLFTGGMTIPAIMFAIGMPLFLFYYLNQKEHFIISIILSFLFPVNILISCLLMFLLMCY